MVVSKFGTISPGFGEEGPSLSFVEGPLTSVSEPRQHWLVTALQRYRHQMARQHSRRNSLRLAAGGSDIHPVAKESFF